MADMVNIVEGLHALSESTQENGSMSAANESIQNETSSTNTSTIETMLNTLITQQTSILNPKPITVNKSPNDSALVSDTAKYGLKAAIPEGFLLLHNDLKGYAVNNRELEKALKEASINNSDASGFFDQVWQNGLATTIGSKMTSILTSPTTWTVLGGALEIAAIIKLFEETKGIISDMRDNGLKIAQEAGDEAEKKALDAGANEEAAKAAGDTVKTATNEVEQGKTTANVVVGEAAGLGVSAAAMGVISWLTSAGIITLGPAGLAIAGGAAIIVGILVAKGTISKEVGEEVCKALHIPLPQYNLRMNITEASNNEDVTGFVVNSLVGDDKTYTDEFVRQYLMNGSSYSDVLNTANSLQTLDIFGTGTGLNRDQLGNYRYTKAVTESGAIDNLAKMLYNSDENGQNVIKSILGLSDLDISDFNKEKDLEKYLKENKESLVVGDLGVKDSINKVLNDYVDFFENIHLMDLTNQHRGVDDWNTILANSGLDPNSINVINTKLSEENPFELSEVNEELVNNLSSLEESTNNSSKSITENTKSINELNSTLKELGITGGSINVVSAPTVVNTTKTEGYRPDLNVSAIM